MKLQFNCENQNKKLMHLLHNRQLTVTYQENMLVHEIWGTAHSVSAEAHLFKNSMYSACLMSPVLIMMVWKHCRSMAHNFTLVRAEEQIQRRINWGNVFTYY